MRLPHNISKNTVKVYHPLRTSETSASVNFRWDIKTPKRLNEICIEAIAETWKENPIVNEIALLSDICTLLDLLLTDLPLELTVARIAYDVYWLRCYRDRWPKTPPLGRNFSEVEVLRSEKKEVPSDEVASLSNTSPASRESFDASSQKSASSKSEIIVDSIPRKDLRKSWKQHYLEAHLREALENLEPASYNPEKIMELSTLCKNHVTTLELRQLKAPMTADVPDHIPLNAILSGLSLLTELSICYKQTYVGEKFSWHIFNTTMVDITTLVKGLEQVRLKTLRIRNSDINCVKVKMLLKPLLKNDRLRCLDFSHCKIAEHGTMAICKFVLEHGKLETLILSNNYIGPNAAHCLAYVLSEECSLLNLDLRLNIINSHGGKYLINALTRGAKNLRTLSLAGCGLTDDNVEIEEMLRSNVTLENLDLSNNRVGEDMGKLLLQGLNRNRTLLNLDVRRCSITPETEYLLREKVHLNRKSGRRLHRPSGDLLVRDLEEEVMNVFPEKLISEINNIVFE